MVNRIHDEVRNTGLRERLVEDVESGDALDNTEAAQVYDLEVEPGTDQNIRKIVIGPHAQYRMDLREVTVPAVRTALRGFLKVLNDWKSQKNGKYERAIEDLNSREGINFTDPRIRLTVVFRADGRDTVKIITTYWKGESDPHAPGQGACSITATGYRPIDLSGYQTFVEDPHPQDRVPEGRKQRLLPSPPWGRSKPFGRPEYNGPGESGSQPDGKSLSKDKPRTLGVPGEDSPPPNEPARTSPKRRPGVDAAWRGEPFPTDRQENQKGDAKRYYRQYYKKHRNDIKRRSQKWYVRHRNLSGLKKDRRRRREFPQKYERRPAGGVREPAERTQEWREEKQAASRVADFYYKKFPVPGSQPTQDRAGPPRWWGTNVDDTRDPPSDQVVRPPVIPSGPGKTIPNDPDFANRQAARIADIRSLCSPDLVEKSTGIPVKMRRVDTRNLMWLFDVKGSKGKIYRVRVKGLPSGNVNDPNKMDVLVSCTCPFWQWQGPEHWASVNGYLYGEPRGTAASPDMKDPAGHHGACKHVLAVFGRMSQFVTPGRRSRFASWLAVHPDDIGMIERVAGRYLLQERR